MEKNIKNIFELSARYDARASFYGKAHVIEYTDGTFALKSYDTIVSNCDSAGHVTHNGKYSATTTRHQREFERQFAR